MQQKKHFSVKYFPKYCPYCYQGSHKSDSVYTPDVNGFAHLCPKLQLLENI